MKFKRITLLAVGAIMSIGLASCGSQGGGTGDQIKVTFWHNSSNEDAIVKAAEAFKKVEPNIVVESVKESGTYDQLKKKVIDGIAADNYPDIFYGYPDAVCDLMQRNVVANLQSYVDAWDKKSDLVKNYLEEGSNYYLSGIYSLPFSKSTEAMYYSSKILGQNLKQFDATLPENVTEDHINNLTWTSLFEHWCPALEQLNNKLIQEGKGAIYTPDAYTKCHGMVGIDSDENFFITLCHQYGYPYTELDTATHKGKILFNNDGIKAAIKALLPQVSKGYLITQGVAGDHPNNGFVKGACLFSIGSTGGVKYQKSDIFDTRVARIPHCEGKQPQVVNQGPSIAILKHTKDANYEKRVEAAFKFYKFFCEKYSTAWAINTGYFPITESGLASDEYQEHISFEGKDEKTLELLLARVGKYASVVKDDYFLTPVFKGSATCRTQVGGLMTEILKNPEITDEEINQKFDTAYNNVLKDME